MRVFSRITDVFSFHSYRVENTSGVWDAMEMIVTARKVQ